MPKLDLYAFGQRLLETNDLDPVYVMLWEAKLDLDQLQMWLLAYFCFYHSGTASWITDGHHEIGESPYPGYWSAMEAAAASKDYPRCHERRHFRGNNATKSVKWLGTVGVHKLFAPLLDGKPKTLAEVMKYIQTWVGFGPWIAFKVADVLERLRLASVQFDGGALAMFDSPREGAELAASLYAQEPVKEPLGWAVASILSRLGLSGVHSAAKPVYLAPPRLERPINVQEAETILCKWKSHWGGHYRIGEDVASLRKSLEFRPGPTARKLLAAGKKAKLWSN